MESLGCQAKKQSFITEVTVSLLCHQGIMTEDSKAIAFLGMGKGEWDE
jgi:hypothetical protein